MWIREFCVFLLNFFFTYLDKYLIGNISNEREKYEFFEKMAVA